MGNCINNIKIVPTNKSSFVLGIIDPQNDFFKEGSLAVPNAEEIIGPINKLRFLCYNFMNTFISQDYHPYNHMSFASTYNEQPFTKKILNIDDLTINQTLWPDHCVQNTKGSKIHNDILKLSSDKIVFKGTKQNVESYSAFGDEYCGNYENTGLKLWLNNSNITNIIIVGLATDYCVYNTVLDASHFGFNVHLILSCIRGVDKNTTEKALIHMKELSNVYIYDTVEDFYQICSHKFIL